MNPDVRDRARQIANVVGALFQVGMTAVATTQILVVVNVGPRSPIEPAGYAFAIWAVIFALSLGYAGYQALPRNRANPVLRRVGWFTAGAFLCTGLWSVFVPLEQTLAALVIFLVAWLCLFAAYRGVVASGQALDRGLRWSVALPIGVFLGWVTAADLVSLHAELVSGGVLVPGAAPAIAVGAGLLAAGGIVAAAIVWIGRAGVAPAALGYGLTVLWALLGIVVNQWGVEPVTVVAASLAALPILAALLANTPVGPSARIGPFTRPPRRPAAALPRSPSVRATVMPSAPPVIIERFRIAPPPRTLLYCLAA